MKKIILLLSMIFCTFCLASHAVADGQIKPVTIRIGVPKAPPALPVLYMMESRSLGDQVTIKLDTWEEPETLIALVQSGEHQMFAFPLTVIAKLHNKGLPVQLMNVNTWGVTYFVTSDPDLKTWSDLSGKTIYLPLQSSPPDALTQFFLARAGLEIGKDVKLIYGSYVEIATLLAADKIEYATEIEPQLTRALMANPKLRIAFNFEEDWQRMHENHARLPNAGFGVTLDFAGKNPELVASFQKAYAEAVDWVNAHPAEAGALAQKYLGLNAELVEKSLPRMGLMFKSARDAKDDLTLFYHVLMNFDPKMIGGKPPGDSMYYDEK